MRGVVTVATALALSRTVDDGSGFPSRDEVVLVALLVVTLTVQGLTLAPLIRWLGAASGADVGADVRRLQRDVTQAAVEELRRADGVLEDVRAAVLRQYEARLGYREGVQQSVDGERGGDDAARHLRELSPGQRGRARRGARGAPPRGGEPGRRGRPVRRLGPAGLRVLTSRFRLLRSGNGRRLLPGRDRAWTVDRGVLLPTKQQVLAALDGGTDYRAAAARLGIHPGLAYLIATGMPADSSDVPTPEELERPGVLSTSTQHLANPPASKPESPEVVHDWLRRRAQSDPQMVEAARSRTATPGPVNDPQGSTDVLTVLRRQHDAVDSMVKQLVAIPGRSKGGTPAQASERESIVDLISKHLAAHETAEEEHLWPRVREVLPDGDDWAAGGTEQEQKGDEVLLAISRADCQTEEFDDLAEQLTSLLHKHVAYEDRLFLRLEKALSAEERSELGEWILAAQRNAPTRPHPHAPRSPGPAVKVAAKTAVPLDKARDSTGRPADREGRPDEDLKD